MIKLTKLLESRNLFRGAKFTDFKGYNKLLLYLKKDCSEILKLYKNSNDKFLLRGVSSSNGDDIVKYKIRSDRKPSYLEMEIHNAANGVITDLGGVAHRGNSIFCTTNERVAPEWGTAYIVFPINGFNATYFSRLSEAYMYNKLTTDDSNEIKKIFLYYGISFDKKGMFDKNNENTEYLIQCENYYGLRIVEPISDTMYKLLQDIENI